MSTEGWGEEVWNGIIEEQRARMQAEIDRLHAQYLEVAQERDRLRSEIAELRRAQVTGSEK